ncbi:MAG: lysozyme inhibitor LprI family protein [Ruegeria sp.]
MRALVSAIVFSAFGVFSTAAFAQPLQSIDDFDPELHLNLAECFKWEYSDQHKCFQQSLSRCYLFTGHLGAAGGAQYCSHIAFVEIDDKLNEVYPIYLAAAKNNAYGPDRVAESEEMLRAAQRAWIAYRDAMCEIEATWNAVKSGYFAVVDDCKSRLTLMQMQALHAELGGFVEAR